MLLFERDPPRLLERVKLAVAPGLLVLVADLELGERPVGEHWKPGDFRQGGVGELPLGEGAQEDVDRLVSGMPTLVRDRRAPDLVTAPVAPAAFARTTTYTPGARSLAGAVSLREANRA